MTPRPTQPQSDPTAPLTPLTSAQFHILLTLAEGERHGYGIMQEVEHRTGGATELGPGTLYRSIKQLLARDLIREVEDDHAAGSDAARRRTYAITGAGRACALEEARRLQSLARWAAEAMALEGGRP